MAVRAHANRNPAALMYDKPMTRRRLHGGALNREPLCLFDNCLETDGALAAVLVSAERARDCPHPPALRARLRAGAAPPARVDGQLLLRRPAHGPGLGLRREAVVPVRLRARRHRRGADLRRLHPAHPAVARGLRVLQAGRGAGLHRRREPALGRRVACRRTPRAAGSPRPTSTGSTSSPRACARCAGPRPARWPAPDLPRDLRARVCPRAPSSCGRRDDGRAARGEDRLGPLHGLGQLRVLGPRHVRPRATTATRS